MLVERRASILRCIAHVSRPGAAEAAAALAIGPDTAEANEIAGLAEVSGP